MSEIKWIDRPKTFKKVKELKEYRLYPILEYLSKAKDIDHLYGLEEHPYSRMVGGSEQLRVKYKTYEFSISWFEKSKNVLSLGIMYPK